MVVVDDYSIAESLSTNSPSFASLLSKKSKKSALCLSPKLDSALSLSLAKKPTLSLSTNPALSNCQVAIRKSSAELHKTMESKAKENSLENTAMSAATWLLAAQKEKPKSEHLDLKKIFEIINQELKSTLNPSTVRQYVNRGHIGCGRLQKRPRGTIIDDDTYAFLLEANINHCQLCLFGSKDPNLKDLITQTKVVMNIEKSRTVEGFLQSRLCADAAGTFKASKQYDQEARRIAWTTFSNLNT
jgi:hypothetical protein